MGWGVLNTETSLWKGEKSRPSDRKAVGGPEAECNDGDGAAVTFGMRCSMQKYMGKRVISTEEGGLKSLHSGKTNTQSQDYLLAHVFSSDQID